MKNWGTKINVEKFILIGFLAGEITKFYTNSKKNDSYQLL